MAEITPMMKQYLEIKEQNKDSILFFRLGDFYEMFNEDAQLASRELDLTLTTRDRGKAAEDQTPMCGIPYHSSDAYIAPDRQGLQGRHLRADRGPCARQGPCQARYHPRHHARHGHRQRMPRRPARQLPLWHLFGRAERRRGLLRHDDRPHARDRLFGRRPRRTPV